MAPTHRIRILETTAHLMDHYLQPLSEKWYDAIESVENNARPGKRFLVRRHIHHEQNGTVVIDYMTTRTINGWERVTAGYFQGEASPYPADYDGNRYQRAPRRLMDGLVQSVAGRIFLQQDK